jgi:small subunit ribosomal protein S27Ae
MAEAVKKEKPKKTFEKYKPVKACAKCGAGMGEHSNRFACGKCGYTEFKSQKKETKKE